MKESNQYTASWQSPSNIALVKYWGKKGQQFEDIKNPAFESKILAYLENAKSEFNWLATHKLIIHSKNTFPHSSGIASSASAFSALALCLCDLHEQITGEMIPNFHEKASHWARLGSGSACRSVYGGFNLWGHTNTITNSSDLHAINIDENVHNNFKTLTDTILIVEKGKKSVSSTQGHALLKEHPFAQLRYQLANENTNQLLSILKNGEIKDFIGLVEAEALMLHALMMTSPTPFILIKPNTLAVLEKIWEFRNQTNLNLLFTLDAGANVHLISTAEHNEQVQNFVKNELVGYCQNGLYFCNAIGQGPKNIKNA